MRTPIIAFSLGDPAGIGPEVCLRSLSDTDISSFTPVIYASHELMRSTLFFPGYRHDSFYYVSTLAEALPGRINILDAFKYEVQIQAGRPSEGSGQMAYHSLHAATLDLKEGSVDALVTAPIDKQNIQQDDFKFPGHTEYLASATDTSDYLMLLVSGPLRVGVVTGHIPLKDVSQAITKEAILQKLKVIHNSLKQDFASARASIAVFGLNPHAGDQGLIGREEKETIIPAIHAAQAQGIDAHGPFPADGFFGTGAQKEYDAILAMYHDQGLVPFKALSFGSGVNFTAGLPVIRTSPDHGTAFDIAGKGVADIHSFQAAIALALDLVKKRQKAA